MLPVRAALEVLRHRDQLPDLDAALALLGVAIEADSGADPAPEGETSAAVTQEEAAQIHGEFAPDRFIGRERERQARRRRRGLAQRVERAAAARHRTMVAYMLAPDKSSPEEDSPQPTLHYQSVPWRRTPAATPPLDPPAESWTVARAIHDHFRAKRPGRIDIEACVVKAARYEPITLLPRATRRLPGSHVDVLLDTALTIGPLRRDVDAVLQALEAVARIERTVRITWTGDGWLGGAGPIWQFRPLAELQQSSTPVVLTGAHLADSDPRGARWTALAHDLGHDRQTVVVSIGSAAVPWRADDVRWLAYEAS